MENEGLKFTSMTIDPVAVSENTARKREKERLRDIKENIKEENQNTINKTPLSTYTSVCANGQENLNFY